MKKKLVAVILTSVLLSTSGIQATNKSIAVKENQSVDKIDDTLENIIMNLKKRIQIPEEMKNFSYNIYGNTYSLYWSNEDQTSSIDASCQKDGMLMSYYYYGYAKDRQTEGLATLSYDEAINKAVIFLDKAVPEYAYKLSPNTQPSHNNSMDFDIMFNLTYQGIPLYEHQVSIGINKYTGDVSYFNGLDYDDQAHYSESVPILTQEKAQELYLSQVDIPLVYNIYWDTDNTNKSFLAYNIQDQDNKGINALNGKVVKQYTNFPDYVNMDLAYAEGGMGGMASNGLTPSEQQAIDKTSGMLSTEELRQKGIKYFPILERLTTSNMYAYISNEEARQTLEFVLKQDNSLKETASLTCNPITGEIYWYSYNSLIDQSKKEEKKWTQQQATAFIQEINKNKMENIVFKKETTPPSNNLQVFEFQRCYNGILVDQNNIIISYDPRLQQVVYYNMQWQDNITFPPAQGILDKKSVMEKIGLELYYIKTAEHEYTLVYRPQGNYIKFDAKTGQQVDYMGQAIEIAQETFYKDVVGHKDETIIRSLYDNGIFLPGNKLEPDKTITQGQLIALIIQAITWYGDEKSGYNEAINRGILTIDEKNPLKALTKEEGIRYLINATPYKKVAQMADLYRYPFKEGKIETEMKGYIALAYGFKMLGKEDSFDAKQPLTKAEALVMLYQLLKNKE